MEGSDRKGGNGTAPLIYRTALLVALPGEKRHLHESLLREVGLDVVLRDGARDALRPIEQCIDVVLVDTALPGARGIARGGLGLCPIPPIIAISASATALAGFELAQAGFSACLEPPILREQLSRCLEQLANNSMVLESRLGGLVGRMPLKDAQREFRTAMLSLALSAANGSRRSAARLLGVTRPAIQRMLREADEAKE